MSESTTQASFRFCSAATSASTIPQASNDASTELTCPLEPTSSVSPEQQLQLFVSNRSRQDGRTFNSLPPIICSPPSAYIAELPPVSSAAAIEEGPVTTADHSFPIGPWGTRLN